MPIHLTTKFKALRQAFRSPTKFVSIAAGRRSGKTWEGKDWIIEDLLWHGVKNALWVDTVQRNIDKYVTRYFIPTLGPELFSKCKYNAQKQTLTFPLIVPENAEPYTPYVDFGSAEKPENLEGFQYERILLNEAGLSLKRPSLWLNTILPMTKGPTNQTRIVGTPKGRNQFWDLFLCGIQHIPGYESFSFTAYDSPYWDPKELDAIKSTVPLNVWNQEYMAMFLENNAGVFRNIRSCIKTIAMLQAGISGHKYAIGIDLAKHTDFTVIVVVDVQTNELVYFDRFNQIDWVFQKQKIIDVWQRFNQAQTMIDSTGIGDPIFDDLYRVMNDKLHGYKITNATKKELIEGLSLAVQGTQLYYPSIEMLISELESYEYEISRSGNVTYSAPEGLHDDCVIALALAWQLLKPEAHKFSFTFS